MEGHGRRLAAIVLAALSLVAVLPLGPSEAAVSRRFGSVVMNCDDDNTCLVALTAKAADGTVRSVVQIARSPVARSRWTVAVSTLADLADRDRPVSFAVDGSVAVTLRPPGDIAPFVQASTFYVLSQQALDRLMRDMSAGFTLRFSYIDIAGGPHTDRYALDGLSAAMIAIDRQQQRIAGDRRAGPPPPDLPPAPDVDQKALVALQGVPPRLRDWHLAAGVCEPPGSLALASTKPVIAPLSATAMLYALPCFVRDGRPSYRLYLIESGEIGGMHVLYFATWSKRFGWSGTDTLEAIRFDPEEGVLTAESIAGAGGCGNAGRWTFDDYAFRLDEMRAPADCDAQSDPASWAAVFTR